ncbi:hypothetical protein LINPERHAP1_LOCUS15479 [Linum perenne]
MLLRSAPSLRPPAPPISSLSPAACSSDQLPLSRRFLVRSPLPRTSSSSDPLSIDFKISPCSNPIPLCVEENELIPHLDLDLDPESHRRPAPENGPGGVAVGPTFCGFFCINDPRSKRSHLGYDSSEELLGVAADVVLEQKQGVLEQSQGLGSVQMDNISGSFLALVAEGEAILHVLSVELSDPDWIVLNVVASFNFGCFHPWNAKGIMTCGRCSGECVVWEESIDEQPWEKARSMYFGGSIWGRGA